MGSQKRQPGFLIAQMIAPVRHFVAPVRKETDLRTDCPDCLSDPQGVCDECAFANDVIGVGSGAGIPSSRRIDATTRGVQIGARGFPRDPVASLSSVARVADDSRHVPTDRRRGRGEQRP